MPLFKNKPKLSTEECCRQFYDQGIFKAIIGGVDFSQNYDTTLEFVTKVDPSFAIVDTTLFRREMIAIRMEMFALAWWHICRFNIEKSYPQSIFTRRYLEENGHLDIWDTMREYNLIVSQSATMNAKGEVFSGRIGRSLIVGNNSMRANLFKDWLKRNLDAKSQTKEADNKMICIGQVINRLGADYKREECILVRLLSGKLVERLRFNSNLKPEAFHWLQASIFGFYKGAEDYLKSLDMQE